MLLTVENIKLVIVAIALQTALFTSMCYAGIVAGVTLALTGSGSVGGEM